MMWSVVLLPFIVGFVTASNNGWLSGTEYVYKVTGRTLTGLSDISAEYSGVLFKAKLTLQQTYDGTSLVGYVSDAHYASVFKSLPDDFNSPISDAKYKPVPFKGEPFQIVIKNDVVVDFIVDYSIPSWEANMLKGIVSQIQIDTQRRNLMLSTINQLPVDWRSSAVYKTMEDTVTGVYETLYEINPLPEYSFQMEPYLKPVVKVKGDGDIIEIVKTKNFSNAAEESGYYYGLGDMGNTRPLSNKLGDLMSRDSISRIIITGNLKHYTIQSSVTTNKIAVSPTMVNNNQRGMVVSHINLTLISMKDSSSAPHGPRNPVSLGNLVYSYENPFDDQTFTSKNWDSKGSKKQTSYNSYSSEERSYKLKTQSSESVSASTNDSIEEDDKSTKYPPGLFEPPNVPLLPYYVGYMGKSIKTAPSFNIISKAIDIALDIGKNMEDPIKIPKYSTLSKYIILSSLIRVMSFHEIKAVTEQLYHRNDLNPKDIALKAFRDALAEAGTGPALKVIEYLILSGKMKNEEAAETVSGMAQSVREPTEAYVKSFYNFISNPIVKLQPGLNVTSLLRFSELVNNVYINRYFSRNEYPVNVFGRFRTRAGRHAVLYEYVPYLKSNLDDAVYNADSHKIQVYISALGSVGHPVILKAFEPYLKGEQQLSHHQRLHIVNSLEGLVRNYPEVARNVLYRIYQNTYDDPDVRVAAVYQLARTGPSPTMLERMADYTTIDKSEQVNSAVKSVIQHVARLKESQNYKSTNAKSAKPFLSNIEYGPQYSHDHKRSFGGGEKTTFQYVASEDAYLPKSFRLAYRSNYGGFSRQYFSLQPTVSSINELARALMHQFQEYLDATRQQKEKSNVADMHRYSAENIVRILGIKVDEREQAEGNIMFKIGGYKRMFTFDNHTIDTLPELVKEIEEILRIGSSFKFMKFFNRDEVAISFPTEMALPFLYTFDVPTVLSLSGNIKVDVDPKLSTGKKLKVPESIHSEGDLNFILSYKVQGQLGFITPCDHQHYFSGYEKSGQLYLPINHTINVNKSEYERELKVNFNFQNPEHNTRFVQYESKPYTGYYNILNLKPATDDPSVRSIGPPPQTHWSKEFGRESTGMIYRFDYEGENKFLDFHYLSKQIQQHNYAGIIGLWEDQNMGNRKVALEYIGDASHNKFFEALFRCKTGGVTEEAQEFNTTLLYNVFKKSEKSFQELYEQGQSAITSKKMMSFDIRVLFGKRLSDGVLYQLSAAYTKSKIEPNLKLLLLAKRESGIPEIHNYYLLSAITSHIPILSDIDAEEVLKSHVWYKTEGFVRYAEHANSAVTVLGEAEMVRTDRRMKYMRNSELYKRCQQEMKEGNKQLYACEKMVREAKYPDKITIHLKEDEPEAHSLAEKIYGWLRWHNFVSGDGDDYYHGPEALNVDADFSPDYSELNASISTRKHGARTRIRLYDIQEPEANPVAYWTANMLPIKYNRPYCVVDKTAIVTFDNLTYPGRLENRYAVLLVHTQSYARYEEGEQSLFEYMKSHNNYAILARENDLHKKVVKIYLRTIQTGSDVLEIELRPGDWGHSVLVNREPVNLESGVLEYYDFYVELYRTPVGEVKLDVKGDFSVVYDGERVKLLLNSDKHYGSMRGLCGNGNFMKSDEFRTPENCIVTDPDEFIYAYEVYNHYTNDTENSSTNENKKIRDATKCYDYYNVYANAISEADVGRYSWNYPLDTGSNYASNNNCMKLRTRYVEEPDEVCFTIKPLPNCKPGCKCSKTTSKIVPVHCVKKGTIGDMYIAQIDKGADPDFGHKKPTKNASFDIQHDCHQS